MNEDTKYDLSLLVLGIFSLYLGFSWKKPSYGGGFVQKYTAIVFGSFIYLLCYNIITWFGIKNIAVCFNL